MSSHILFNHVQIGDCDLYAEQIVPHSGLFRISGYDQALQTLDGLTHFFRISCRKNAELQVYGDFLHLASAPGFGTKVSLYFKDEQINSFQALVSATCESDPEFITTITLSEVEDSISKTGLSSRFSL